MESVQKPKPRVRKARKKLEHKENGGNYKNEAYVLISCWFHADIGS